MVKKLTKWNYLEPFLFTQEPLHLEEIAKKLNQNHTTARNHLNTFTQEGVLKKSQKARLTLYQINKDFPLLIDYLAIAEKESLLRKAKDPILKELIADLQKKANNTLVIFGSTVHNYDKANDIDILCLEKIQKKELEKKYRKTFHILHITHLNEMNAALKQEIKKKHIIISNVEQVVKWLQ